MSVSQPYPSNESQFPLSRIWVDRDTEGKMFVRSVSSFGVAHTKDALLSGSTSLHPNTLNHINES